MARINIDMNTAEKLNSYDVINDLRNLIQEQLDKPDDEVDIDFVDECVNALLEIEQDEDRSFVALVPLMTSEKFLKVITDGKTSTSKWKSLNRFARIAIVAAVLAGSTFTVNAAVESATGIDLLGQLGDAVHNKLEDIGLIKTANIDQFVDDDSDDVTVTTNVTESTTQATTEQSTTALSTTANLTTSTTQTTIQNTTNAEESTTVESTTATTTTTEPVTNDTTQSTTRQTTTRKNIPSTTDAPVTMPQPTDKVEEIVITKLKAEFDNFKSDYIYGEELTYDGLKLTAVYSDGSEQDVALSDCDYTRSVNMNVTADYTLRIIYQGCVVRIDITVRPDEDTRGATLCSNDLYDYMLTEKGAYITAYRGDEENINLDYLDNNEVIAIGAGVFEGKSVKYFVAQNVKKIFANAFRDCTNLVDCYTPSAVYIGNNAFDNCSNLNEAVYSDELTYFGLSVYKCSGIESISIPSGVTEIPASFCESCLNLKTVDFNGKVTKISAQAFMDCSQLETVTGTEFIEDVGANAFSNDTVATFDYPLDNLKTVGAYAFNECHKIEFGSLPSIKQIDNGSFAYCWGLKEFTVPKEMTQIPYAAFCGSRVEVINFHDNVTAIGDFAFMSAPITEIHLPKNLVSIGTKALYMSRLRNAYFTSYNTSFEDDSFFFGSKLVFYVYKNSSALTYAEDNEITYVIINDPNVFEGVDQFNAEDD
jgi:hypothetical protein